MHQISLLNRLLADLTIQSISSKSYVNPHIVGKAKKNQPQKPQLTKYIYFWGDLFIIGGGGGVFINRGKRLLGDLGWIVQKFWVVVGRLRESNFVGNGEIGAGGLLQQESDLPRPSC